MRFGTMVPEAINERIQNIDRQLQECLPYQDDDHPENVALLDAAINGGAELLRYASAIKGSRVYGWEEVNKLREREDVQVFMVKLLDEMKDSVNMSKVLSEHVDPEQMEELQDFIDTCHRRRVEGVNEKRKNAQ